jgi:SAM-dependent methyltransferase
LFIHYGAHISATPDAARGIFHYALAMPIERAMPGGEKWDELAAHHLPRYLFACTLSPGKRVLDAGAGAGYGSALLAAQSAGAAADTVAIDIDAGTVDAARRQFGGERLTFLVDGCETLAAVRGPFDLIVNFENIEHLRKPDAFLAAACRQLAPGGALLVSTPDRANAPPFKNGKPDNPFHVTEWYRDEFAALLAQYFKVVDLRVQVESHGFAARREAVEALRQALAWANPVGTFLWRKLARTGTNRSWRAMESLAAATMADFPIVAPALAPVWGKSYYHFAICREPRTGGG